MGDKIYVKTVYGVKSRRLPNISRYERESEADDFVSSCSKYGIDIMSCEKISLEEAELLLKIGQAEQ